jgi:hypothetical protein
MLGGKMMGIELIMVVILMIKLMDLMGMSDVILILMMIGRMLVD